MLLLRIFSRSVCARMFLLFILTIFVSCKKIIEIPDPINSITDEAVYSTDQSAASVLTSIYMQMGTTGNTVWAGLYAIPIVTGLSSDELYLSSAGGFYHRNFFSNSLVQDVSGLSSHWNSFYNFVYRCNAAIEGINASKTLSPSVKNQLLGEAYFLRAFNFFYLVNSFGPVPLALTTEYQKNAMLSRAPESDVYAQIVNDLKKAQEHLSEQFMNGTANAGTEERVRPSKWAANALLARVYLYMEDYANAIQQSNTVINNSSLFEILPLNNIFLKVSKEAIWQIQPVSEFWNTEDAKIFIIPSWGFDPAFNPFYLNSSLMNSAEPGDQRFTPGNWVNTITLDGQTFYYPFKYKENQFNPDITKASGTTFMKEYLVMLRLGEQYLIRAEAYARQGELSAAIADIDVIRQRAGLPLIAATQPVISQEDLIELIIHERRAELFTEGGHRWFDLKRTGLVDEVMIIETPVKGGVWNPREALYPISPAELDKAPNITQTPGYPRR